MGTGDNEGRITRVLFCGQYCPAAEQYTKEYLQVHPFIEVDDVPLSNVPNVIGDYHICVVKSMKLSEDIISRARKMKLIMQFGVGLECVDVNAATSRGIRVARIPSDATGNAASCAEMAIYLMLGLLRKQNEMKIVVEQKRLGEPVGDTLQDKTVIIIGYGNIGEELAKRLRPFGVKIVATKRSWAPNIEEHNQTNGFLEENTGDSLVDKKGRHEDINELARIADIVVCCLRLDNETVKYKFPSVFGMVIHLNAVVLTVCSFECLDARFSQVGIVDQKFLSSMKKGALLVNIARGGLLNYEAVLHHLESGHLGGLGIDVAWTEPFDPTDPILKFQNVLITPHVGGVTERSYRSMAKVVGDIALQLHTRSTLTGLEFVN